MRVAAQSDSRLRSARLGLFEAVALSVGIIAPTMAMAFNVSLAAPLNDLADRFLIN